MEIQDLLAKKKFEALSAEERAFVLQKMSQKDYETQHQAIRMSRTALEKEAEQLDVPAPNPKLLMALKQKQLDSKPSAEKAEKKKGIFATLLAYHIPAWQAVAAALILVFMVQFWNTNKEQRIELAGEDSLIDTVIVEKIVTKVELKEIPQPSDTVYKVIYKTKYVSEDPNKKPRLMAEATTPPLKNEAKERATEATFANVMSYYNKSKNRPASQDTFLQIVSQNVQF